MKTRKISIYAMIMAVYAALTLVLMNFGFGQVQVRLAEVMCCLVLYKKEFILPITLACALTNLIGVFMGINIIGYMDILFGTLATFLSLITMYRLKDIKCFNKAILAYLMPVLFNALIVGGMLSYVIMPQDFLSGLLINGFYVGIGEMISVLILGIILDSHLQKIANMVNFD